MMLQIQTASLRRSKDGWSLLGNPRSATLHNIYSRVRESSSVVTVFVVPFSSSFLEFTSLVVLTTLRWALRSASMYTSLSAQHHRGAGRGRRWRWRRGRRGSLAARGKVHRRTYWGAWCWHGYWHWHRSGARIRRSAWWGYGRHTAVLHTGWCTDLGTWGRTHAGLRGGSGYYERRWAFTWLCWWSCEEMKIKKKLKSEQNWKEWKGNMTLLIAQDIATVHQLQSYCSSWSYFYESGKGRIWLFC